FSSKSASRSSLLVAHDLFRKPISTFRDHALASPEMRSRRNAMKTSPNAAAAPSRRRIIKGLIAAGVAGPAVLRGGTAFAAWPERPVRIVVANTPGGPSDIIARIMAAALTQAAGRSFFAENRRSAGGHLALGPRARAGAA